MGIISYHTLILLISAVAVLGLGLGDSGEDHPPHGPLEMLSRPIRSQIDDCMSQYGIMKDELKPPMERKEPSEKQLCFLKCISLATGVISKDGEIIIDKIKDNISKDSEFPSNAADEILTCLKALGEKINDCADMKKIVKCMPKPPKGPE